MGKICPENIIKFDYITCSDQTIPVGEDNNARIQKIFDLQHASKTEIVQLLPAAGSRPGESQGYVSTVSTLASWTLGIDNSIKLNGLTSVDPISVTFDGSNDLNFMATYYKNGTLAKVQASPFLEHNDLAQLEHDGRTYPRFALDFTDGSHFYVSRYDHVAGKWSHQISDAPVPSSLTSTRVLVGRIDTNTIGYAIPVFTSATDNYLCISFERVDGQQVLISVPKKIPKINLAMISNSKILEIINFPFELFAGSVIGDRTPPAEIYEAIR